MTDHAERHRLRAVAALLATVCLFAAVACGGGDSGASDDAEGGSSAPAEADPNGELRFAYSTGYNSFDPHLSPTFSGDQVYQRQVYDRLLTLERGDDDRVVLGPQLATAYEVAGDGLSITFTLREDVTFQDGTPFDADAVKANIERALGPDSTVSSLLHSVESVEVVDPVTVVFHLSQPDPSVPWLMATNTTGMMASPAAFGPGLANEPVGTGPFTVVSAQKDGDVVYERWDGHWDPEAAQAQRIVYSTIPDQNARYNALRSGELDAAFLATPLDAESQSLEDEGYQWTQVLSPVVVGMMMNTDKPPFDDVRVRQAVSMAFNRQEISDELVNGVQPPVFQSFAEGYVGYDPDLDEDPYDPDAAADLVEEAGATGATVEIIQQTPSEPQSSLAVVAEQALGEIGLEVELTPVSPTEARALWREGGHQAMIGPIIGQIDPGSTLAVSYLAADNPATPPEELVRMADEASALPPDSPEQEQAYQEISAWLIENPIHAPIFQFSTVIVARPNVVGAENMMITGIADLDFRGVGVS
jgi:peptide/nickel transport system substrate-binding protein